MNIVKPHPNVFIRTTVNINLSAEQWGLRTDTCSREIIEKVATFLNKKITHTFNIGCDRKTVEEHFNCLADHFKLYGATDKSARAILKGLLDELFNHRTINKLQ
jgi:hypothetical protein